MGLHELGSRFARIAAMFGLVVEAVDFAGDSFDIQLLKTHQKEIAAFGGLLFLISLVIWLETAARELKKLDDIRSRLTALDEKAKALEKLQQIEINLEKVSQKVEETELIAKYGAGGVWLARLLHPKGHDEVNRPHCRAGGEVLSHLLLEVFTKKAEDFYDLQRGRTDSVELEETSTINLFLRRLVKALPPGSVWLGTSKLQNKSSWEESIAPTSYWEFEDAVERKIDESNLKYMRVYCFESDTAAQEMAKEAKRQASKGLLLRKCIGNSNRTDISLIWVETKTPDSAFNTEDPLNFLESQEYQSVCGIRFDIQDGNVKTMELFAPEVSGFNQLRRDFEDIWPDCAVYP